jgi:chemotaxis protein MotB
MSKDMRRLVAVLALASLTGCHCFCPRWQLRQAQLRTYQMYRQGQMLAGELGQSQMLASQLTMENQQLAAKTGTLEQDLALANDRLRNLADERGKLNDEYKTLLTSLPSPGAPLSGNLARMFEDLCRRYPEFEFDPLSGVARFNGELLFAEGSNEIRPDGFRVLQEFARIMNDNSARQFRILVVGHTDDQPVVHPQTRARHETNWELSAHRATAVVRQLARNGLSEPRMGIAGYNMYQPATPNTNDSARQKNRRVEIFVLPPETSIAAGDSKARK